MQGAFEPLQLFPVLIIAALYAVRARSLALRSEVWRSTKPARRGWRQPDRESDCVCGSLNSE